MKAPPPITPAVDAAQALRAPSSEAAPLEFDHVYERHYRDVLRWSRALGAPDAEREDLVQQIFLVVFRKLSGFDGKNLRGWLYRITARTLSDFRRRVWFRSLIGRRHAPLPEELASPAPDAMEQLERKERQRRVRTILEGMSEKRRVAFALYEIEGYSGEEIAEILQIPNGTVWTRLQAARIDFMKRLAALEAEDR